MNDIKLENATVSGSSTVPAQGAAKTVKTNRITAFNRVITSSRKLYARQLDKNASVKHRCLVSNIAKHYEDAEKFWAEYTVRKEDILDSGRFRCRCKDEGLTPEVVAEHLLFEGSAVVNRVLKTGFESLNGSHRTYTEPIVYKHFSVEKVDGSTQVRNRGLQLPQNTESAQEIAPASVAKIENKVA